MCRHTANRYELCNHESERTLQRCHFSECELTTAEMRNCLFQAHRPPHINNVHRFCPSCARQHEVGALAAEAFWQRMEQGRKEARRRATGDKIAEKEKRKEERAMKKVEAEKRGNWLWRKVLNRNRS